MVIIWFGLRDTVRLQFRTTVSSTRYSPAFQIYQEQLAVWGRRVSSCEVKQGHYFNVNPSPFNTGHLRDEYSSETVGATV